MEEFDFEESSFEDSHLFKLFETARRKINKGRTQEALEHFMQNIQINSNLHKDNQDAIQTFKKIIKLCINKALILFFQGEPAKSLRLFKYLEKITVNQVIGDPLLSVRAEIYHFLSIVYKKMGAIEDSQEFLTKAKMLKQKKIEQAQINLNICQQLALLARNKDALNYAIDAMILSQEALEKLQENPKADERLVQKYLCISAISYHSIAVQYENLGQIVLSLDYYKKAYLIYQHIAPYSTMTQTLKSNYTTAKKKAQQNEFNFKRKSRAISTSLRSSKQDVHPFTRKGSELTMISPLQQITFHSAKAQQQNKIDLEERPAVSQRQTIDFNQYLKMNKLSKINQNRIDKQLVQLSSESSSYYISESERESEDQCKPQTTRKQNLRLPLKISHHKVINTPDIKQQETQTSKRDQIDRDIINRSIYINNAAIKIQK